MGVVILAAGVGMGGSTPTTLIPPIRQTTAAARPAGEFRNRGVSTTAASRPAGEFPVR